MPTSTEISQMMVAGFKPEKAEGVDAVIQFDLSGDGGGQFYVHIANQGITAHEGVAENPKMTLKASAEDYYNVATGKLNAMQAFMGGKIKIQGDMGLAMKMQGMFSA
ncbi:MAG: SCP2 sterol-binding domain-containing protein [bacterium]|jgi:putative sterol carrier protein|nr:SCP2 sterol-binding domain-containing protein [bacterium]